MNRTLIAAMVAIGLWVLSRLAGFSGPGGLLFSLLSGIFWCNIDRILRNPVFNWAGRAVIAVTLTLVVAIVAEIAGGSAGVPYIGFFGVTGAAIVAGGIWAFCKIEEIGAAH